MYRESMKHCSAVQRAHVEAFRAYLGTDFLPDCATVSTDGKILFADSTPSLSESRVVEIDAQGRMYLTNAREEMKRVEQGVTLDPKRVSAARSLLLFVQELRAHPAFRAYFKEAIDPTPTRAPELRLDPTFFQRPRTGDELKDTILRKEAPSVSGKRPFPLAPSPLAPGRVLSLQMLHPHPLLLMILFCSLTESMKEVCFSRPVANAESRSLRW